MYMTYWIYLKGNGLNFSTMPTWASEISGHEERGKVAAFNGWLIIWGVVIAYWYVYILLVKGTTMTLLTTRRVDYGCAGYLNDMQFRLPIGRIILARIGWLRS